MKHARRKQPPAAPRLNLIAAVPEGLEPIAHAELASILRPRHPIKVETGALSFAIEGEVRPLLRLRTLSSLYLARSYDVPRPRGLLGHAFAQPLLDHLNYAMRLHPGAFKTLFISAAGSDSVVMQRLRDHFCELTGLQPGEDDGDLLLRLRPTRNGEGWELLVRLSPRPLATRAWRLCNREGALNGAVAHAMALLTSPHPRDRYLNVGCGSGTLLIERLLFGEARQAIGCDLDPEALECAYINVTAAKLEQRYELNQWDATDLPLADGSMDAITSDLPFGHLVGSHAENQYLYPALLGEAARVARRGALGVFVTHEIKLMEQSLAQIPSWEALQTIKISLSGLHPRIFVLRRR